MKGHRLSVCFVLFLSFALRLSAQQAAGTPAAVSESPSAANAFARASQASLPRLVKFSGTVKDTAAGPLMGITFALYKDQEGGAALWLETQNVPLEDNGHYSVLLGANSSEGLPIELFTTGEARWLGVQPEHEPELPRVLLVSVPYALKAGDAQTLGGLPPSAFAPANFSTPANAPSSSVARVLLAAPVGQPEATTNAGTAVLAGGGTTNFIPLWSNSTTLGSSILFQSTTSNVNVNGSLSLPPLKAATATVGANSQPLDLLSSTFSSNTHAAVSQHFRWQAEPTGNNTASPSGKLNLLYAAGTAAPAETGLSINNKGIISFASGQTLPAITGNETVTGNVSANQLQSNVATGTAPFVVKSTTQVANLNASFLGGMPASSFATHGANSFSGTQSIFGSGQGMFLGDVGCGSQYAEIAFAPSFGGCTNYSLAGDGTNTFIGKPPNGTVFFIGLSETGSGVTDMQINPDGTVGIGTATSSAQLTVQAASGSGHHGFESVGADSSSAAAGVGILAFGGVSFGLGGGGDGLIAIAGGAKSNGLPGGVGAKVHGGHAVSGGGALGGFGVEAFGGFNGDGSLARAGEFHGDVEVTGCLSVSPGTTAHAQFGQCLSDVRLKKSIQTFPAVLDNLVRLQPVSYNWRTEEYPQFRFSSGKEIGLIAQEVEKVFPDMVSTDQAGYKRVNYGELPLLMLQAIRELKAENEKLQEELKTKEAQWEEHFRAQEQRASLQEMQQQMAALEARLARVESRGGSDQTSAATPEVPKRNRGDGRD
jgi:hypothetical protein